MHIGGNGGSGVDFKVLHRFTLQPPPNYFWIIPINSSPTTGGAGGGANPAVDAVTWTFRSWVVQSKVGGFGGGAWFWGGREK